MDGECKEMVALHGCEAHRLQCGCEARRSLNFLDEVLIDSVCTWLGLSSLSIQNELSITSCC